MVLKTFNVENESYNKFSEFCRENGLSMSSQINTFIKSQVETSAKVRAEYLLKLDNIRKGKFIKIASHSDFEKRYNINYII